MTVGSRHASAFVWSGVKIGGKGGNLGGRTYIRGTRDESRSGNSTCEVKVWSATYLLDSNMIEGLQDEGGR